MDIHSVFEHNVNTMSKSNLLRYRRTKPLFRVRRVYNYRRQSSEKLLGLHHVLENNRSKCYKIFWVLFIALCVGRCLYQIHDRVNYYFSHPVKTHVTIQQQQYVKFPTFTLCPCAGQYYKLHDIQRNISKIVNRIYYRVRLPDIIKYSGLNVDVIWQNTAIIGKVTKYILMDSESHFEYQLIWKEFRNTLGICYIFTVPEVQTFNKIWRVYFKFNTTTPCCAQIYVALHPEEDYPNFFYMNPHYYTNNSTVMYSVSRKKFVRKSTAERQCKDKQYVSKCRRDCYFNSLRSALNCRLPNMPYSDLVLCTNPRDSLAALEHERSFQNKFDVFVNCSECSIKCQEDVYSMNLLHNAKREEDVIRMVYSYENNMVVVTTEEYAYLLVSLLCDVGGNLGLFMGLCIISVAEIFEQAWVSVVKYLKTNCFTKST